MYVYIVQCIWDNYKPCFEIDIQKLLHWSRNFFAMFVIMMTTIGNLTIINMLVMLVDSSSTKGFSLAENILEAQQVSLLPKIGGLYLDSCGKRYVSERKS